MLDTQKSTIGNIPWGLMMKLDFQSWRIGSIFGIFVINNGEDL
jgi:hypothetical protein